VRIGILCHSSVGGSARVGLELAHELARRGHRVHVFTRSKPFGTWDGNSGACLHCTAVDALPGAHSAVLHTNWTDIELEAILGQILQVANEEGLDLLHFHYALPFAFLVPVLKQRLAAAAPLLVGTLHGTDVSDFGRDPITAAQLSEALGELNALTTVSVHFAYLARDTFRLSALPIVIPNFVNLSHFHPALIAGDKHRSFPARIAHLSNFRPVKDAATTLQVFSAIRDKVDAELWLIGDGPDILSLRESCGAEWGHSVRHWGFQPNVAQVLARADLLLMSSLSESFCLAALEAMACGLPVVATNVGGLPEVVLHGRTGYLYAVGDHASAVSAVVELLSDPPRYRAMSIAARQRARRYGQHAVVTLYEQLYTELLATAPVGAGRARR
jgi:L-malate glycosyltransferase